MTISAFIVATPGRFTNRIVITRHLPLPYKKSIYRSKTTMTTPTNSSKPHLAAMDDVVSGRFVRKPSSFRNQILDEPDAQFSPEVGRYRLYVSLACPWAHRCLLTRSFKGLEDVIPITVVHHYMGSNGWSFITKDDPSPPPLCEPEPLFGFKFIRELYFKASPEYDGRFTVPVLWDTKHNTIVNNESSEIIVMLNEQFDKVAKNPKVDLFPQDIRTEITEMAESFYNSFNNGVYRCGFAKSQQAYDEAFHELFECLDRLENHLATNRYLIGSRLTLADIRLFVTLIRFDAVYVLHFKTNKKRIFDYPNLSNYTMELYQMPQIKKTVNFTHIKHHYFGSHPTINPLGIVPNGPDLSYLEQPHDRERL